VLQAFSFANDIDADHQMPSLISLIEPKTYTLLKNLISPDKVADKTII
jgi:hypothetical protein